MVEDRMEQEAKCISIRRLDRDTKEVMSICSTSRYGK